MLLSESPETLENPDTGTKQVHGAGGIYSGSAQPMDFGVS
jgi:hypothetical protein